MTDIADQLSNDERASILAALRSAIQVIRKWRGPVGWDSYLDSDEMKEISDAINLLEARRNSLSDKLGG